MVLEQWHMGTLLWPARDFSIKVLFLQNDWLSHLNIDFKIMLLVKFQKFKFKSTIFHLSFIPQRSVKECSSSTKEELTSLQERMYDIINISRLILLFHTTFQDLPILNLHPSFPSPVSLFFPPHYQTNSFDCNLINYH